MLSPFLPPSDPYKLSAGSNAPLFFQTIRDIIALFIQKSTTILAVKDNMIKAYFIQKNTDLINEDVLDRMISALPKDRREKALRFRFHEGKVLSALSWLLLSYLLEKEDIHHGSFEMIMGKNEKPLVKDGSFFFNISHTNGAVLAAAGFSQVGADIQRIMEKDTEAVAKRVFTPSELSLFKSSNEPEKEFTRLWTLKESYIKYTGSGISGLENAPDFSNFNKAGGSLSDGPSFLTKEGDGLYISICSDDEMELCEISIDEILEQLPR